jgi:uncharacterized protein YndB with AHSA1/START domain
MARNEAFIAASPRRVFAVLSDPATYADWVPGAREIRSADRNWPAEGTSFDHALGPRLLGIADHTSVTASLAPVMLELRARARPLGSARVILSLQPEARGTRVTMIEDPASPVFSLAIGPLGHGLLRLRNTEALRRLKKLAERDGPAG